MQRRLYIDKAHTALDIFRFAVLFLISLLGAIAIAVGVVAYIEGVPPVSLGWYSNYILIQAS